MVSCTEALQMRRYNFWQWNTKLCTRHVHRGQVVVCTILVLLMTLRVCTWTSILHANWVYIKLHDVVFAQVQFCRMTCFAAAGKGIETDDVLECSTWVEGMHVQPHWWVRYVLESPQLTANHTDCGRHTLPVHVLTNYTVLVTVVHWRIHSLFHRDR
jgi:hypothetical protein